VALVAGLAVGLVAALLPLIGAAPAAAQPTVRPAGAELDAPATQPRATGPRSVPAAQRAAVLGPGWRASTDRAWLTAGDADGFHVLVADAARGYEWRTVATLAEPGLETDQWIGNGCVTGSGRRAVVVYAPRTFTNSSVLFDRGGFTAVVDLTTGAVTKLPVRTSLAYFNPGCGAGEEAVLTQGGDEDLGRTRLLRLDAAAARIGARIEVPGQLTSPVPTAAGIVAADRGALVRVDGRGGRRVLATATGVPFRLAADADGGVVFMQRAGGGQVAVRRATVPAGTARAQVRTLAAGPLAGLDVTAGRGGRVFVTGAGKAGTALPHVSIVDVPAGSRLSLQGRLALTSVLPASPATAAPTGQPTTPLAITATALGSGRSLTFSAVPAWSGGPQAAGPRAPGWSGGPQAAGRIPAGSAGPRATGTQGARPQLPSPQLPSPQLPGPRPGALPASSPTDPADPADRYCSVPRNDPRNQAMQPKPRQVEWAVDQAVREVLTVARPANWKNLGMPAYTPQGLFPSGGILGGSYVPAQIMLGIAAQESNLWQATRYALPGVTANPLIGNYYGLDLYNDTEADDWTIRWDKADCGYGVMQVTDHMRLAGHEKGPDDFAWDYQIQRAVGLDFATNVAAGLRILQNKWTQVKRADLQVNNGDPTKIENWFYAVWAYNSGFHEDAHDGSPWGLGWANNPVNPRYPANRPAFLDTSYGDAAHPQNWPYPEKVIGWAGHPVEVPESPGTSVAGFRPAWWNGGDGPPTTPGTGAYNRRQAQPPVTLFCDNSNQCHPGEQHLPTAPDVLGEPAGPCAHTDAQGRYDLRCWYHQSATWKPNCSLTCGNELVRFDPGYAYQDDGTAYPPRCDLSGLPGNAFVIDDVPDGTPVSRPGCTRPGTNAGTFTLGYRDDGTGHYPGKIDTHQIGGGFGGHFWFSHTRTADAHGGHLDVTATWRFNTTQTGLGRLLVALPDHLARTATARYVVKTAYGDRISVVPQQGTGNRWVSLGTFRFNGQPEVSVSSVTPGADGSQEIALDAMAFVPVTQAPTVKMLHWNVAGATRNDGNFDVIDRLIAEVQARRPDAISVNEICSGQYGYLDDRLRAIGYPMTSVFQVGLVYNPTCFNLHDPGISDGNAVFVRGTVSGDERYIFDGDNKLVKDADPSLVNRNRSVACIITRFDGTDRDTKVCSTHLAQQVDAAPNPYAEEEAQTRELARVFGPQARTTPFILAGDFNIRVFDSNDALGTLYGAPAGTGDFGEVDQERRCLVTTPCQPEQGGEPTQQGEGGRKIDYVFTSRWHTVIPVGRVEIVHDVGTCGEDHHACSDHWIFRSEVQLPRD
jgi:endonuclease/exonuclease/phosphatase family metal-dependent hydrolase